MDQKNSKLPFLLEGRTLKSLLLARIKMSIQKVQANDSSFHPSLAIFLVGDDPSSQVYVQQKKSSGESIGIQVLLSPLPHSISEEALIQEIDQANKNPKIHGILVQLPLPPHISPARIFQSIHPKKDVDGVHPLNMGLLLGDVSPYFIPATPLGILKLLEYHHISVKGKNVVILNRSPIVGKPLSCLLGSKTSYGNATVTLCHRQTQNILEYTQIADILVTATSVPHIISEDMVKPGCIVIDLGQSVQIMNGKRYITGDMKVEEKSRLAAITPVPGGVGPMTVASLMENIFKASLMGSGIPLDSVSYDFF